jgi:uncharacterized delta-60 repeat protein
MSTLKTAYRKTLLATLIGFSMGVGPVWAGDADPDVGFGDKNVYVHGGLFSIDLGGIDDYSASFGLLDNANNLLAVGQRSSDDEGNFPVMARYDMSGNPDESTGWTDGYTRLEQFDFIKQIRGTLVQKDGKVLVLDEDFTVYRFIFEENPDDNITDVKLDTEFGDNGKAAIPLNRGESFSFALHENGSIIVAGISRIVRRSIDDDITVVRYNKDGKLDKSFGNGSGVFVLVKRQTDTANSVVIPRNGARILVGGSANNKPYIWSVAGNGSGAVNFAAVSSTNIGRVMDLAIQPDDKVVALVQGQRGTLEGLYPIRWLSNGAIDGKMKILVQEVEIPDEEPPLPARVIIQPDGKILFGATVGAGDPSSRDIVLMRLNSDGKEDLNFTSDSGHPAVVKNQLGEPIQYDFDGMEDRLHDLRIDSDGYILAGGRMMGTFGLARLEGRKVNVEPNSFGGQTVTKTGNTYVFTRAITVGGLTAGVNVPVQITCTGVTATGLREAWNGCSWRKNKGGWVPYQGWVMNKDVLNIQVNFGSKYKTVEAEVQIGGIAAADNNDFIMGSVRKALFKATRR